MLASETVQAMLGFAAGRSPVGVVSATALYWTFSILRTMQMTRLVLISTLLAAGLVGTGVAAIIVRQQARARPTMLVSTPSERQPHTTTSRSMKVDVVSVRVVDLRGRGVPNVEVEVFGSHQDRSGARYRTEVDGRVSFHDDPDLDPSYGTQLLARPDDQTIGWAWISHSREEKRTVEDSIPLVLLPRTHRVEGLVVDKAAKPLRGVQIRVWSLVHKTNMGAMDLGCPQEVSLLGSAVTAESGRYQLQLPIETNAILIAHHPWFVGPLIECGPDVATIAPVTLKDGGGIAGRIVDGATGRPVGGARIGANKIEFVHEQEVGAGRTISDVDGHFRIGGLPAGVYNLCLESSPSANQITAQAIEGVRVKPGEDAPAKLTLAAGRRLQGTVVDATTGKPIKGVSVFSTSAALPSSGHMGRELHANDEGRFEFFVPPGPTYVHVQGSSPFQSGPHRGIRTVSADRDPAPVLLKSGTGPDVPAPKGIVSRDVQVRVRSALPNEAKRNGARTLMGRLFDQDGSPVPGVQVIWNEGGKTMTIATDRLGVFRRNGSPSGKWFISMDKLGYQPSSAIVPIEALEVEMTMPRIVESE